MYKSIAISNIKKLLLIIILFVLSNLLFVFPALAASVTISPANVNINAGSQFTIAISVTNVTNLFGAAFDLIFNPAVLSFVSVQKGSFLEQGAETTLLTAVNPAGDLIVGYSRSAVGGVFTGVNGSGNLMTLTFNALSTGTSGLTFQNNNLCDASGSECNPISATWNNGNVVVTSPDTTPPAAPSGVTII